jgi:hypothetical protein
VEILFRKIHPERLRAVPYFTLRNRSAIARLTQPSATAFHPQILSRIAWHDCDISNVSTNKNDWMAAIRLKLQIHPLGLDAESESGDRDFWSGRWESKSSPLGFSRTYVAGLGLIWKDLVVSGTLTAASMSPCFPRMFLTTLRFASRTALGTACV